MEVEVVVRGSVMMAAEEWWLWRWRRHAVSSMIIIHLTDDHDARTSAGRTQHHVIITDQL